MSADIRMIAAAQWLNDYMLPSTLALAVVAAALECRRFARGGRSGKRAVWLQTWRVNLGLLACALAVLWLLAPLASPVFGAALSGQSGVLKWLAIPASAYVLQVVLGVLLLDVAMYWIHRAMHAVPLLWRLHQVHHSDEHMNASTHFRQHPGQIVVVAMLQLPLLWLLGIPAVSWVFYAVLGIAVQMWQHSALVSRPRLEQVLSRLVVTPLMHRTHHDRREQFHHANYGAVFPLWDHLFSTYRAPPQHFQPGLLLPTGPHRLASPSLLQCLSMPFMSSSASDTAAGGTHLQTRPQGKP